VSLSLDAYCSRFGLDEIRVRLERSTRTLAAHRDGGGLRHRVRDPQIVDAIATYEAKAES
jgi:hypothetical protein